MQVILAGYNIDKSLIDKYIIDQPTTPEVISAAYARISRSSKTVEELRQEALKEIQKARASNENIIFEMGHSSIAEHAVFNIDIVGVSRLLTESIQRSRIASYTEKSQRYVTFNNDYILPKEFDPALHQQFKTLVDSLFAEYKKTLDTLLIQVASKFPHLKKREQEGMAKEDARYILPLATKTQLGMTINARSLEALIRRIKSVSTLEAQELAERLYSLVNDLTPSLIRYTEPDQFYLHQFDAIAPIQKSSTSDRVSLLSSPPDADNQILAALLYSQWGAGYHEILNHVASMDMTQKAQLGESLYQNIKSWHKLPRAFEMAEFSFELQMSESCWAQFKRHRLCTIIRKQHTFDNIHIIPPHIPAEARGRWAELLAKSCELAQQINLQHSGLGAYALTNAHQVTVLVKMNLRELHHFVRLRSDEHAQWEIRDISNEIAKLIRTHCPITAKHLMGKSEFAAQK